MSPPITPKYPATYHFASTGNSTELRKELRPELSGKVRYGDSSVLRRLGVFDIDDSFVASCHKAFHRDREQDLNTPDRKVSFTLR